ncbi:MAG: serine/threonine protein kinase, partial [Kofleriaceae bacterium]|nr:serine/threonine protein kinase [Kofleriaceae bacterium]
MNIGAGQQLGKYELIEKVGQGGMAVVYRGIDKSLNREVAIKVLHSHLADNEEARARFGREAHAVAKLRHENILEIHDFSGLDSDENYIVTEFIDGCTLREFTSEHAIHFPEIGAMITVQVCRALAHAHGLGVLHRDVKPENIMIRSDGVVKLTDFGISQMVDMQRMTVTGQLLGSPAYMSPEHVRGGDLDFRTDVFAVGIVLYQLVTGDMPFQGKNPHEILKRIADCVYPDPSRVNARVGSELARIINTALAAEPDDRFADISLMQQALEEYIEGSGLSIAHGELERFFAAPAAYQMALETRLVDYLCERGQSLMDSKSVGGLEYFNRVLSIDENNTLVVGYLRKIEGRQRQRRIVMVVAGIILLAGLSMIARKRFATSGNSAVASAAPIDAGAIALLGPADAAENPADAAVAVAVVSILDASTIDPGGPA